MAFVRYWALGIGQACIKGGQPKTALQVHRQLTKNGAVPTDEVIATLLVQAHAMTGDFDEAFHSIAVSSCMQIGDRFQDVSKGM